MVIVPWTPVRPNMTRMRCPTVVSGGPCRAGWGGLLTGIRPAQTGASKHDFQKISRRNLAHCPRVENLHVGDGSGASTCSTGELRGGDLGRGGGLFRRMFRSHLERPLPLRLRPGPGPLAAVGIAILSTADRGRPQHEHHVPVDFGSQFQLHSRFAGHGGDDPAQWPRGGIRLFRSLWRWRVRGRRKT